MKGTTHAVLGVVALAALTPLPAFLPHLLLVSVCAGVGALLPDLDSDESLIRHETHTARSDGPLGWLVSAIMPSHRGVTHSGLAALLVFLLARAIGKDWALALAIGYAAHIAADMLTRQGVPLLWPIHWRLSLLPLTTGGAGEAVITVAAGGWLLYTLLGRIGISLDPVIRPIVAWVKAL